MAAWLEIVVNAITVPELRPPAPWPRAGLFGPVEPAGACVVAGQRHLVGPLPRETLGQLFVKRQRLANRPVRFVKGRRRYPVLRRFACREGLQPAQGFDFSLGQDRELAGDDRLALVFAHEGADAPAIEQAERERLFLLRIRKVGFLGGCLPNQALVAALGAAEQLDQVGVGVFRRGPGEFGPVGQQGRAVDGRDHERLHVPVAAEHADAGTRTPGEVAQALQVGRQQRRCRRALGGVGRDKPATLHRCLGAALEPLAMAVAQEDQYGLGVPLGIEAIASREQGHGPDFLRGGLAMLPGDRALGGQHHGDRAGEYPCAGSHNTTLTRTENMRQLLWMLFSLC